MLCAYNVKYHDYAVIPLGETARPDVHRIIQTYVSLEGANTAIVNEAAKFMNELNFAHIDRIEKTFITVKYHEGKIDRYRRFYFENCDDADFEDNDVVGDIGDYEE